MRGGGRRVAGWAARRRGALRGAAAALLALAAARGDAAAQDWVPRAIAQLQALDKVTARVSVFEARVGEPARFDTLTIVVRACHARPPEEVPDAAAWMEITDSRAPAGGPPAFRGWMFANAPGVHMLEHPVYDIRILACR
jgi:hypothetical protein